jgi:subtilisin family serine protease
VVIRYCNLIFNEGSCIDLVDHYLRVFVSCSNVSSDPRVVETTRDTLRDTEIHITCSLFRDAGAGGGVNLGSPVTVAVIDSGIDRSIPALNCYMWRNAQEIPDNGLDDDGNGYIDDLYGWDFSDDDADSLVGTPMHWHGTFVAGVLADSFEALMPPTAAGPSLRIMDLRFLDSRAQFYTSDWPALVRAIDYAVAQGARVINLSIYASREPPAAVREAVMRAIEQGVLVVAIAGNDASSLGPIARWEEVVTVGAVDVEGEVAPFSNIGAEVDLAARGVDVLSLLPDGIARTQSGTSFAAPLVAGVAAFHVSVNPSLSPVDIEAILRAGAIDVGTPGHDIETGWGLIE